MKTWDDYENYVKAISPESKKEIEECEELSRILTSAFHRMNEFGLTISSVGKTGLYNTRVKKHTHHKGAK